MQKFYIHRTQPAYVTEIIEVEAESNSAARQCAIDGVGDTTIGLVVGDYLDAPDTVEVFDAAPHNIPMGFLPLNGEAMLALVRQLARMDPPDEREEIAEVDGEIEAFSHMIRKAKEIVGAIPAAPVAPAVSASERAMFELLCENATAWEGEEESVREEHEDLIAKTEAFIEANRARLYPPADPAAMAEQRAEKAASAVGWRIGDSIIYDSNVFDSWKEAVSWAGEDDAPDEKMQESRLYSTWVACCEGEGIEVCG